MRTFPNVTWRGRPSAIKSPYRRPRISHGEKPVQRVENVLTNRKSKSGEGKEKVCQDGKETVRYALNGGGGYGL
jgi:hypothetical protein